MSDVPGWVLDRLRTNLRTSGIPFEEHDFEAMAEFGMLRLPIRFETDLGAAHFEIPPDMLDVSSRDAAVAGATESDGGAGVELPPASDAGAPGDDPLRLSLLAIADRLRARELSPIELVERSLARVRERQPRLNAFSELFEDRAHAAARRAEGEIATGHYRGPLHGVPVAVKDLFDVRGAHTHAGSRVLGDGVAQGDATVVERLESAGAILVGKTRMAELAYSPSSENPHYGPTRNPWNPDLNAGGSSSGSGAAVADGWVFGALGSDTAGSIRIPAAYCGIVGLKPTFGRVSLYGAIPLSWSLDHAGPMTRTCADAWVMLAVLAGRDPGDPRTARAPEARWRPDGALDSGVRGLRIGVPADDRGFDPPAEAATLAAWRAGLASLERAGATIVPFDMSGLASLPLLVAAIVGAEASSYHQPTLRERSDRLGTYARLRLMANYAYAPTALPLAQQARALMRRRCDAWFDSVDLVSTPTMPGPAPAIAVVPPTTRTSPFNLLGWPAISVPVGLGHDGLPRALQLAGPPWQEARVLRAARVVEAESGVLSTLLPAG